MYRRIMAGVAGVVASLVLASSALAFECTNASKVPDAGAQIVIDLQTQEILWISQGLQTRIDQGLIDFETGEGFHGLLAFDIDGDEEGDVSIWFGVGPEGEIPLEAQFRGPACHGLTNVGILLTQCLAT